MSYKEYYCESSGAVIWLNSLNEKRILCDFKRSYRLGLFLDAQHVFWVLCLSSVYSEDWQMCLLAKFAFKLCAQFPEFCAFPSSKLILIVSVVDNLTVWVLILQLGDIKPLQKMKVQQNDINKARFSLLLLLKPSVFILYALRWICANPHIFKCIYASFSLFVHVFCLLHMCISPSSSSFTSYSPLHLYLLSQ